MVNRDATHASPPEIKRNYDGSSSPYRTIRTAAGSRAGSARPRWRKACEVNSARGGAPADSRTGSKRLDDVLDRAAPAPTAPRPWLSPTDPRRNASRWSRDNAVHGIEPAASPPAHLSALSAIARSIEARRLPRQNTRTRRTAGRRCAAFRGRRAISFAPSSHADPEHAGAAVTILSSSSSYRNSTVPESRSVAAADW